MMKRALLAVILIFICWSIIDFVIHGLILQPSYGATAALWRPMEEMKMGLMRAVVFVSVLVFVTIYVAFFRTKSLGTGIKYGILFGLGSGISMGCGTYSVMPVPYTMALTWFLGNLVEGIVAGLIVGSFAKQ